MTVTPSESAVPRLADVLDLRPRIAQKRTATCEHLYVEVDENAADLSCADCGAALDPWWYIRTMAQAHEEVVAFRDGQQKHFDDWRAQANATVQRLGQEIAELVALKNKLWNERGDATGGRPLGSLVRRHRPRKATRS